MYGLMEEAGIPERGTACLPEFPGRIGGEDHGSGRIRGGLHEAYLYTARRPHDDDDHIPPAETLGHADGRMRNQAEDTCR